MCSKKCAKPNYNNNIRDVETVLGQHSKQGMSSRQASSLGGLQLVYGAAIPAPYLEAP